MCPMTRRRVIFYAPKEKTLYMTPEFNGDKSEFGTRKINEDSCDKNWDEIMEYFKDITTLSQFEDASKTAQAVYHSSFGNEILSLEEVVSSVSCDKKIYINSETMIHYFYLLYRLEWANSRGYNIADYDFEKGFNGESWVCLEEFKTAELQDEEYMHNLLDDNDFEYWRTYNSSDDFGD
jgi:hypothetical protein